MKYLLLAKSNVKKTKSLTVCLLLLIALAACFLNVFLLINFDFNKNAVNVAEELNSEDAYILTSGDIENIDETYIHSLNNKDIADLEINQGMFVISELPYGNGNVTAYVGFGSESLFDNQIGKFEIIESDDDIIDNYVYLPYQFYTGGGFNIGDNFKFKVLNNNYEYKIKGFINTITLGSNNVGAYQLILSDNGFNTIKKDTNGIIDSLYIKFKLKDGVNSSKFLNSISNKISKDYPNNDITSLTLDDAISGRTFLGIIFAAILLIVCSIVLIIVILMISNNISNFIRENIKTLGALKAIGYTTRDITISFLSQFIIIDLIGSIIGIILSKYVMQLIGNIMVIQSGIPYKAHFIPFTIIITIISLLLIVFISLLLLLRKTKNIEPIVALREGDNSKSKKRNIVPLEKSHLPISLNLSIKTTFTNMKQNLVTAIITFFLIMMSSLSLVLFQNFTVKPKISLMTFEICDGNIMTDSDTNNEVYNYLNNLKKVKNVRLLSMSNINVEDAKLQAYIVDDTDKMINREVIYEGKFPKNSNEIAISGKFAQLYNYEIGDQIEVKKGNNTLPLKVTGYIQSLNNGGMESLILKDTADKLIGTEYDKIYYFDTDNEDDLDIIFDSAAEEFGPKIKSTLKFQEAADGSLGTFKTISFAVVILVAIINMLVMLLVLYMLIKTLINKKKKEYGILKALGYTSRQIIFQNAISFIPTITISVIAASIISCYSMNYIICIVMKMFGIMKLTFDIPINLICLTGIGFILLSFIFSLLLSRKIKKIEPYKLIIGD